MFWDKVRFSNLHSVFQVDKVTVRCGAIITLPYNMVVFCVSIVTHLNPGSRERFALTGAGEDQPDCTDEQEGECQFRYLKV